MDKRRYKREIIIDIDNDKAILINNVLFELVAQLADGYWENEENFYEELWIWLDFKVKDNQFIISVKKKPTYVCRDIFSSMSDKEVINYLADTLDDCYDEAPFAFRGFDDDQVLNVVNNLRDIANNIGM